VDIYEKLHELDQRAARDAELTRRLVEEFDTVMAENGIDPVEAKKAFEKLRSDRNQALREVLQAQNGLLGKG